MTVRQPGSACAWVLRSVDKNQHPQAQCARMPCMPGRMVEDSSTSLSSREFV